MADMIKRSLRGSWGTLIDQKMIYTVLRISTTNVMSYYPNGGSAQSMTSKLVFQAPEKARSSQISVTRLFFSTILLIAALLVSTTIVMLPDLSNRAQAATRLTRLTRLPSLANGVAQTPPMGWS